VIQFLSEDGEVIYTLWTDRKLRLRLPRGLNVSEKLQMNIQREEIPAGNLFGDRSEQQLERNLVGIRH